MFSSIWMPRVYQRMEEVLTSGLAELDEVILHPIAGQGKGLRPRLVLIAAGIHGQVDERAVEAAVAAECIHTASLIHDDIIDGAILRRGLPSTNSLYGNHAAVLTGDQYFATAIELLATTGLNEVIRQYTRAICDMCKGEILQDLNLFQTAITEKDYFYIIHGKTASLFAAACQAGALAAGASSEQAEVLGCIGEQLGMAYQIVDDVMDLTEDEAVMGKPSGTDIRNGILTLPLIYALQTSAHRDWLSDLIKSRSIGSHDCKIIVKKVGECGGINYALETAQKMIAKAEMLTAALGSKPAVEELLDICNQLSESARELDRKCVKTAGLLAEA